MLVQTAVAAATVECEFTEQLLNLMEHLNLEEEDQPPQKKTDEEKTAEPPAPSVVVAFFAAMQPPPIPAGFGLPAAGDEKGPAPAGVKVETAALPLDTTFADVPVDAPAPPMAHVAP